jgi:hypothetical protein
LKTLFIDELTFHCFSTFLIFAQISTASEISVSVIETLGSVILQVILIILFDATALASVSLLARAKHKVLRKLI